MKELAEVFKGIEFIRISNLPEDQKKFIATSLPKDKIIKILKDSVVMKDCVQYHDYLSWFSEFKSQPTLIVAKQPAVKQSRATYKLAIK